MELKTMIVTDKDGNAETSRGKICLKDNDPFTFYALDSSTASSSATEPVVRDVRIVMPLGGKNTGLFRQPQVGEKILVGKADDGEYYLFGFVPSVQGHFETVFTAKTTIDKEEAQVLRYKNTGDNYSPYPYSEIGFFSKTYARTKKDEETKEDITQEFRKDEIDIQSTGDIKSLAADTFSARAENNINLVSGNVDFPNSYITMDSAGNVAIKAISSISLEVGRTRMAISEDGFHVTSKIVDSPTPNTWDASLSLTPMEGFAASGLNCTLGAVRGASMNDSLGGVMATNTGVVNITGRDMKLGTYNSVEYGFLAFTNSVDFVFNTTAAIEGMEFRQREQKHSQLKDAEKVKKDKEKAKKHAFITHVSKVSIEFITDLAKLFHTCYLLWGAWLVQKRYNAIQMADMGDQEEAGANVILSEADLGNLIPVPDKAGADAANDAPDADVPDPRIVPLDMDGMNYTLPDGATGKVERDDDIDDLLNHKRRQR